MMARPYWRILALACIHCNRFKGPNIAGLDAETGELVRLFHPRTDSWTEHFMWEAPKLMGRTQIGRVTIAVLFINDPDVIALRKALGENTYSGDEVALMHIISSQIKLTELSNWLPNRWKIGHSDRMSRFNAIRTQAR